MGFLRVKNLITAFCFVVTVLFLGSCEKEIENEIGIQSIPTIIPNGDEKYLNENSDYIFDQDKLHTFELQIPTNLLSKINSDPAAEEYVEGMLIFEGDTISPVGVRYKGSIGAFVNCLSGHDWSNPSGYKTCTKLSMKVKMNWEGRDELFYKLRKLQFHSQNLDDSQMHERLGYYLFRSAGVPAPRSVHARLIINGQYSGLYALTEQIDGRFSRYHFDDGKGNVYKEIWPLNWQGLLHSEQQYKGALKTNEDENPSVQLMMDFARAIRDADENELKNVIQNYMDVQDIISFAVVDRMIRNDDGPFHWYCSNWGCSNHNYYWYEEPEKEKLHLIPWDLDNAFENIIHNDNPVTPIADEWGEIRNNCNAFTYGAFNNSQRSAACDKLTYGWTLFREEYMQRKTDLIASIFSEENINEMLDMWSNQIRDATREASEIHQDAISVNRWENGVDYLKSQIEYARNK